MLKTAFQAIKEQKILLLTSTTYRKKKSFCVIQIHFTVERSQFLSRGIQKRGAYKDIPHFLIWSQYLKDHKFMGKRKIQCGQHKFFSS